MDKDGAILTPDGPKKGKSKRVVQFYKAKTAPKSDAQTQQAQQMIGQEDIIEVQLLRIELEKAKSALDEKLAFVMSGLEKGWPVEGGPHYAETARVLLVDGIQLPLVRVPGAAADSDKRE